ncbi:putative exported peptidyl-prolyl cis-trans isomerase [unidentified eubacterium SCB49]|nr:putative exported peptidyl-prolyl cis-trans isomerase [unidentified eubacterium SCB49]
MQLKTIILRYIIKNNIATALVLLMTVTGFSQVAVVDSTGVVKVQNDAVVSELASKTDSLKPFEKYKVEGVTAVVGEYVIVEFDIDLSYQELKAQGIPVEEISRCQLMGKLMEDKLYAHHAKQDSIMVSDNEITQQIDQQMEYMVSELGSEEKVAAYYRKESISELRKELFEVNKTQKLAGEMQRSIIENVEVTPEEVRSFFYNIPEDERPIFSAEVEVAQLVVEPKITQESRQDAIDQLNEWRTDILENGSSFATKAVLYSKDGSAQKGGLIAGVRRNSPMAKEFKDQAFSLLEGEISEPFQTEFGFHILKVDKIRGQELDIRHIIIFPEIKQETMDAAYKKIDTVRAAIRDHKISFADAARKYSDEKETRNNGGQLVNPVRGDTRFDLTKMDPTLSAQVYDLQEGEVSKIFTDTDFKGKTSYKILMITNRYDEHPADYVKDYEKIKELALKQKQIKAIEKWQDEKIKETYVNVNNDYTDCDFSGNWVKK